MCERKVAVGQLSSAAFAAELSLQTKKSRFSPYLFVSLLVRLWMRLPAGGGLGR